MGGSLICGLCTQASLTGTWRKHMLPISRKQEFEAIHTTIKITLITKDSDFQNHYAVYFDFNISSNIWLFDIKIGRKI